MAELVLLVGLLTLALILYVVMVVTGLAEDFDRGY